MSVKKCRNSYSEKQILRATLGGIESKRCSVSKYCPNNWKGRPQSLVEYQIFPWQLVRIYDQCALTAQNDDCKVWVQLRKPNRTYDNAIL